MRHRRINDTRLRPENSWPRDGRGKIGCGDCGNFVARGMVEKGASITFLCDLQPDRLDKSRQFLSEVQKAKPRLVKDMREVFGSKDVDAVVIATPDHWHAPARFDVRRSGKVPATRSVSQTEKPDGTG